MRTRGEPSGARQTAEGSPKGGAEATSKAPANIVAPLPESLLERSIVAPGLLAQILVSKYCDHLPLYRQEAIYWSRHEVWLPRQRQARQRLLPTSRSGICIL